MLAIAVACGPSSDVPEPMDCVGELFCPCESGDECDGWGLGGARGTCSALGFCTIECTDVDDCGGLVAATCGPLRAAASLQCSVACDELDEPCEAEGLPSWTCQPVDDELACGP
jgi:hypothetical protein